MSRAITSPLAPGCPARTSATTSIPASTASGVAQTTSPGNRGPRGQSLAPDHMGDEDLPDRPARRTRVQHADPGDDVGRRQDHATANAEQGGGLRGRVGVPGQHHGDPQPGAAQDPGVVQQDLGVPAIGPAHDEQDIGARLRQALDPRVVEQPGGDGHHPRPGGQRHPAAGLGRDHPLMADDGQPQPAAGRGAHEDRRVRDPTHAEARDGCVQAREHVGLRGRGVLRGGPDDSVRPDRSGLGEGRAHIDADHVTRSVRGFLRPR